MTALAADRKTPMKVGDLVSVPVLAATEIFLGSLVCVTSAGFAAPGADTAGFKFVGVAQESVDNLLGANGDVSIQVRQLGVHSFVGVGLAVDDIGKKLFAADDQTVNLTGGTNFIYVGRLSRFDTATLAHVDIDTAAAPKTHGVDQIESADASDLATAITLVNEIKTALNL